MAEAQPAPAQPAQDAPPSHADFFGTVSPSPPPPAAEEPADAVPAGVTEAVSGSTAQGSQEAASSELDFFETASPPPPPAPAESANAVAAEVTAAPTARTHRAVAPSVGNTASLFGGGDDDFFGGTDGGFTAESTAPTTGTPALSGLHSLPFESALSPPSQADHAPLNTHDDEVLPTQQTPTQSTVDLPSASAAVGDVAATNAAPPNDNTSASLFDDSAAGDDDWLGVSNSTFAASNDLAAAPSVNAADDINAYQQQGSYDQAAAATHDAFNASSWDNYYGTEQNQQAQQTESYSAYDQTQQQQQQYDYSAGQQDYGSQSYGESTQGYGAEANGQQQQTQYDYSQQQSGYGADPYPSSQQHYGASDIYGATQTDANAASGYGAGAYDSQQQQTPYDYSHQQSGYAADPYAASQQNYGTSDNYGAPQTDAYAAQAATYDSAANGAYGAYAQSDASAPDPYGSYSNYQYSAADQGSTDPYAAPVAASMGFPAQIPPPPPPPAPAPAASSNSYSYDAPPVTFRSGRKGRATNAYAQQPTSDVYATQQNAYDDQQTPQNAYGDQQYGGYGQQQQQEAQGYSASQQQPQAQSYDQYNTGYPQAGEQHQHQPQQYDQYSTDHSQVEPSSQQYQQSYSYDYSQQDAPGQGTQDTAQDGSYPSQTAGDDSDAYGYEQQQPPFAQYDSTSSYDEEGLSSAEAAPLHRQDSYSDQYSAEATAEPLESSQIKGRHEFDTEAFDPEGGQRLNTFDASPYAPSSSAQFNPDDSIEADPEGGPAADADGGLLDDDLVQGAATPPNGEYGPPPSGVRTLGRESDSSFAETVSPGRAETPPFTNLYGGSAAIVEEPGSQYAASSGHQRDLYAPGATDRQSLDALGASNGPVSPYEPSHSTYEHNRYGTAADTSVNDSYFRSSGSEALPDVAEERRRARIPCVTFGVDGKIVTYFPSASSASEAAAFGGFGGATTSTQVQVRSLRSIVAPSSYASVFDPLQFPGPIFEGAASGALSRATGGASGASKAKKAAIIAYLRERAEEVEQGLKYLSRAGGAEADAAAANANRQRSADRAVLLRLLALIVEHDGKTSDNAKFNAAARELLAEVRPESSASQGAFGDHGNQASSPSQALATYELTSDFLTELQSKLVLGQRHEAVQFALERRMWAHAMVIASGLDKETWCKAVGEFMDFELNGQQGGEGAGSNVETKALKTTYALFSGQAATQVYDAFRPKVSLATNSVQTEAKPSSGWRNSAAAVVANRSAGDSAVLTAIGDGLLVSESIEAAHVCYLLSPQTSTIGGVDTPGARATLIGGHNPRASVLYLRDLDSILLTEVYEFAQSLLPTVKGQEAFNGLPHLQAYRLVHAITLAELGDSVRAQKYCEAITATFRSGKPSPYFHPILLAQLKEFMTRLVGPDGAGSAAASGNWVTKKMQKPTLDGVWGALEGRFSKFIAGEEGGEGSPTSSQAASKSNGAHGGTIGPFSHFSSITTTDACAEGVRSHPASRAGSAMDFRSRRAASPAARAASALSMRPLQPLSQAGLAGQNQSAPRDPYADWPSSNQGRTTSNASFPYASGYGAESEDGNTSGATATGPYAAVDPQSTGSFASSRSSDAGYDGPYKSHGETSNTPWWGQDSSSSFTAGATGEADGDTTARTQAPGDAPYYGYQPHGAAAPQFFSNVEALAGEGLGASFASPMDAFSQPATREPSHQGSAAPAASRRWDEDDDDDDLGLGNSSNKRAKENTAASTDKGSPQDKTASPKGKADDSPKAVSGLAKKPELRPSASTSSWLGRFWGRGGEAAAEGKPKKVHLGEEKTFYYDNELKRWVNKAAGDTGASTPASTPPPPRAQTASPSVQNGRLGSSLAPRSSMEHSLSASNSSSFLRGPPQSSSIAEEGDSYGSNGGASNAPPPPSAYGFGGPPPPPRARSNLGDPSVPPASQPPMRPTSALGSGGPPPPKSSLAGPSAGGPPVSGASAGPPPPAGGARAGAAKKKPIKARYVVVD